MPRSRTDRPPLPMHLGTGRRIIPSTEWMARSTVLADSSVPADSAGPTNGSGRRRAYRAVNLTDGDQSAAGTECKTAVKTVASRDGGFAVESVQSKPSCAASQPPGMEMQGTLTNARHPGNGRRERDVESPKGEVAFLLLQRAHP
jgi:hypothetical protein